MHRQAHHIVQSFFYSALQNSSKDALIFAREDGTYQSQTYRSVYQHAVDFSTLLSAAGAAPRQRVAILLENRPEFSWACFAVFFTGAAIVPLDTQLSSETLERLLTHCGADMIISSEKFHRQHIGIVSVQWVCIDSAQVRQITETNPREDITPPVIPSAEIAALFYTSGTTAEPKAVVLTHRNFLANIESIKRTGLIHNDDVVLSILPLHHTYAFTVTLLCPLLMGMTIAYPRSIASADLISCMKQTCVTIFVGVPQIFAMIHRSVIEHMDDLAAPVRSAVAAAGKINFFLRKYAQWNAGPGVFQKIHQRFGPSLRLMVSGGARLDPQMAEDFYRWGFTVIDGYGLTETSPVVSFCFHKKPKFGSVGNPLPGVEVRIDRPDQSGVGEVLVRGDNVMMGYYKAEEETRRVLRDGWFYTGDLGRIDDDGCLFLTGRKNEMLVLSNGENIHPEELEHYYGQNPFIKEIAILITADPKKNVGINRLVAIIVPNEEHFQRERELNIRQRLRWELENYFVSLPTYKRIRGFVVSQESLPRTRLGKLRRFELEKIYLLLESGTGDQPKDMSVYSGAMQSVMDFMGQRLGRPVSPSDHLELDLGLDSLSRLEIFMDLQKHLHITLTDSELMEFFSCTTLGQVMDRLKPWLESPVPQDDAVESNIVKPEDMPRLALSYLEELLEHRVSLTDHLELDLGLDSLGRFDLLIGIQQRLGLSLSEDDAMRFFMCGRVCDLLDELNKLTAVSSQDQGPEVVSWRDMLCHGEPKDVSKSVDLTPLNLFEHAVMAGVLFFIKVTFKICWSARVEGVDNLPTKKPYILCANHVSFLDGLFVANALPGKILKQTFFLGDSRFLNHWALRPFKKAARLIPIEFTHRMTEAMQLCAYVLNHGKVLCYFPEGQRSIDGEIKEFRKGIGILIHELDVPVVPVYIRGAFDIWPRGRKWPKLRGHVSVRFGKSITAKELAFKITAARDVYQRIADNLHAKMVQMYNADHF